MGPSCQHRFVPDFETAVLRVLRRLPAGEVVTYGEVALEAGFPGRARAVGRILATTDVKVPWWRVVASTGRLVPDHELEHARRLRAEGVEVDEASGRVRFRPVRRGSARTRRS
jgi:methylated-DNA-protein-cysteine methyltransferase-like protein